jgi:uncharacterized integral membrane protein
MKWLRLAAIAVLVLAAVFVGLLPANNALPVSLHYVVGQSPEMPLYWVVLLSILLGIFVASVPLSYLLLKRGLVMRRYRKLMNGLEAEVHQLRSLPLSANDKPDAAPPSAVSTDSEAAS